MVGRQYEAVPAARLTVHCALVVDRAGAAQALQPVAEGQHVDVAGERRGV